MRQRHTIPTMRRYPGLIAFATCLLLALPATSALAQARLSTDLLMSGGSGSGASLRGDRDFGALGLTIAAEVKSLSAGRLMAGVALSRAFEGPHGDKGYFQPDGESIGGAWPFFRSLSAVGALDSPGAVAARVTAGAGVYRDNLSYTTGGLSGSVDFTIPGRTRVGMLLTGAGTFLPAYRGGSFHTASLGIGVRFSSR